MQKKHRFCSQNNVWYQSDQAMCWLFSIYMNIKLVDAQSRVTWKGPELQLCSFLVGCTRSSWSSRIDPSTWLRKKITLVGFWNLFKRRMVKQRKCKTLCDNMWKGVRQCDIIWQGVWRCDAVWHYVMRADSMWHDGPRCNMAWFDNVWQ